MRQPSGTNEEKTRSIHCFFSCSESFISFYIMNTPYMSSSGYSETKSQTTCTYDLIKVAQACAETTTLFRIQRTGAYNVRLYLQTKLLGFGIKICSSSSLVASKGYRTPSVLLFRLIWDGGRELWLHNFSKYG